MVLPQLAIIVAGIIMIILCLGADNLVLFITIFLTIVCIAIIVALISRFVLYKTTLKKNTIQFSNYDFEKDLVSYMKSHTPCDFLENEYLKLYFTKHESICNIKVLNKKNNKLYLIKDKNLNKNRTATLWGLLCMNFHTNLTYSGLIFWLDSYESLDIKQVK